MRYVVSHRTVYRYSSRVDLADHVAHLRPRAFAQQAVTACKIEITPKPSRHTTHVDHYGNTVDAFRIDTAHDELVVDMRSEVDVALGPAPAADATPRWESVRQSLGEAFPTAVEPAEFVHPSPLVEAEPAALAYAKASFPDGRSLLAGALDLTKRIRRDFAYAPGTTDIATPLGVVFEQRGGVCQDFAHVEIACLRALGLPAAYVSGYIRTYPAPGKPAIRGADASHAWIAVWCGAAAGWIHLDPTNDLVAREEHVVLAWGRDFSDVSPLRGIILGGGDHTYHVSVDLAPA